MDETFAEMLVRHEGLRIYPYTDTMGKWTIGVGRNLTDVGITYQEAMTLLENDIRRVENDCLHAFPWFAGLDETRKRVILNMCFNLGLNGLRKFNRFLNAVELGNYSEAATHMLDSLWAKQVKGRAVELASLMQEPLSL